MSEPAENDPRNESGAFEGAEITIYYDADRSVGVGEAIAALPAVFDPAQDPWIQPDNATVDEVASAVEGDPSGALHYERKDGGEESPPVPTRIDPRVDGALNVHGDLRIVLESGVLTETRASLCRCGRSGNKPFCDKTCERSGWSSTWHPPAE